jgi:hypothetical protein
MVSIAAQVEVFFASAKDIPGRAGGTIDVDIRTDHNHTGKIDADGNDADNDAGNGAGDNDDESKRINPFLVETAEETAEEKAKAAAAATAAVVTAEDRLLLGVDERDDSGFGVWRLATVVTYNARLREHHFEYDDGVRLTFTDCRRTSKLDGAYPFFFGSHHFHHSLIFSRTILFLFFQSFIRSFSYHGIFSGASVV